MFLERKPKFRNRKLDFGKALGLYRFDEVDELDEYDSPLRSVAPVATGVDKEEEDVRRAAQRAVLLCRSTISGRPSTTRPARASRTTSPPPRRPSRSGTTSCSTCPSSR